MTDDLEARDQYLQGLEALSSREVKGIQKNWTDAGYFYAPVMVKTLEKLEETIRQDNPGKSKVLLLDHDMNPFSVVKQAWKGDELVEYDLIPASSAIFGEEPRFPIDRNVSLLKKENNWKEENQKTNKVVKDSVDFTISEKSDGVIAFTRKIFDSLGIKHTDFDKRGIIQLLRGKISSTELLGKQKQSLDYVVLFDSQSVGTYIETTREIIRRVLPDTRIKAVMLRTYNPRIGQLATNSIGDFESIPKEYDLLTVPSKQEIWKSVRRDLDPRVIWASAFRFGLRVGVEDIQGEKYEEVSVPRIPHEYAEKQWAGDFNKMDKKEPLELIRWQVIDKLQLGNFEHNVNPEVIE